MFLQVTQSFTCKSTFELTYKFSLLRVNHRVGYKFFFQQESFLTNFADKFLQISGTVNCLKMVLQISHLLATIRAGLFWLMKLSFMLSPVVHFTTTKSTVWFLPNFMYALYMGFQMLVTFKTDSTNLTLPLSTTIMAVEWMTFEYSGTSEANFTLCLPCLSWWIFCEEIINFIRKLFYGIILACVEFFWVL